MISITRHSSQWSCWRKSHWENQCVTYPPPFLPGQYFHRQLGQHLKFFIWNCQSIPMSLTLKNNSGGFIFDVMSAYCGIEYETTNTWCPYWDSCFQNFEQNTESRFSTVNTWSDKSGAIVDRKTVLRLEIGRMRCSIILRSLVLPCNDENIKKENLPRSYRKQNERLQQLFTISFGVRNLLLH